MVITLSSSIAFLMHLCSYKVPVHLGFNKFIRYSQQPAMTFIVSFASFSVALNPHYLLSTFSPKANEANAFDDDGAAASDPDEAPDKPAASDADAFSASK